MAQLRANSTVGGVQIASVTDLENKVDKSYVDGKISDIELIPGPPGKDGVDGKDGEQGPPGKPGADGYTPVKGIDYFDGDKGARGEQGPPGKDGYTPIKGVDYFDGEQGPKGDTGPRGLQGPQGEQGLPGKDGVDGEPGPKGDKGEQGLQGEQGIQGPQGNTGPKGDTGDRGPQGPAGKDGSDANVTKANVENALGFSPLPVKNGVLENYTKKLNSTTGTINLNLGNAFIDNPTTNRTYTITNAKNGVEHSFTLQINLKAEKTLIFPASVKWPDEKIPDMTTMDKTYLLNFVTTNGGSSWHGKFIGDYWNVTLFSINEWKTVLRSLPSSLTNLNDTHKPIAIQLMFSYNAFNQQDKSSAKADSWWTHFTRILEHFELSVQ